MTDIPDRTPPPAPPPRRSRKFLMVGIFCGVCAAGGLFTVTYFNLLPRDMVQRIAHSGSEVAFVPLDPLVINLGPGLQNRHLRFAAQLEVASPHRAEMEHLRPRMADVMNSYLRAVRPEDLEKPAALLRLRAQLLRRLQLVAGDGRIRDLLVTEFLIT